jgi:hypothetical protein
MKIYFHLPAIFFIAGVTIISFSSCKKSSSPSSIIGNWEVSSVHRVTVDSTTTPFTTLITDTTIAASGHGHTLVASFNENQSYTVVDYSTTTPTLDDSGIYIVISNNLTLFSGSGTSGILDPFVISGNTLTLTVNNSYTGHESIATEKFTRQ